MPGLNSSQIMDRAKSMGRNLSDSDTQGILKQAWDQNQYGADEGKVNSLLQSWGGGNANSGGQLPMGTGSVSNFISGLPSLSSVGQGIRDNLGLDKLQGTAQQLNNTLFNLPQTYTKATMGAGVNANQLARLIGQKQYELAPAAALASSNAQAGEANYNQRLGLASEDQARQITGYSSDMQRQLDKYIADMQNGTMLSENDKNRAQQLALAESGYKNQLQQAKIQNSRPLSTQPGDTVIDPLSGRVLYKNSAAVNIAQYGSGQGNTQGATTQASPNFRPLQPQQTFNNYSNRAGSRH